MYFEWCIVTYELSEFVPCRLFNPLFVIYKHCMDVHVLTRPISLPPAMMSSTTQTNSVATQLSSTPPVSQQQQQLNSAQSSTNRGVQVQILSGNQSQASTNGTTSITNSSQDLLAQLGGIRLAPEQRQLLLAAQLQQQLRSTPLISAELRQGVTLVTSSSVPTTVVTTSSTG